MTLYTLNEAAKILRCNVRTLQRALHRQNKKKGSLRLVRLSEADIKQLVGAK